MKITTLLIFAFCFQVTASTYGQSVSLTFRNAPLKTVIEALSLQSNLDFIYEDGYLQQANPVTVNLKDASPETALKTIFGNQPFQFEVADGIVYLTPKSVNPVSQTQVTIRGKVTDSLNLPLRGVTVSVVGTGRQTSTDRDGLYELSGVPQEANLLFRMLSYETFETLADRPVINVVLKLVRSFLDEPVVIAYGTTTRRLNTGNVSSLKAEDIQRQPISDPILALQGRISGLYIGQSSGVPGAQVSNIRLRGQNSIANGNMPLFLIDGVPFSSTTLTNIAFGGQSAAYLSPFNSLNPADIESIEVLKDADATAIYGSRGANGVILITTKKGQAGNTRINFNAYTGISKIASKIEMLNTSQYIEMRQEAFANDGTEPGFLEYDINGTWDTDRYTDWQEIFLGGTSRLNNANLRFSGGSNETQFTLGGNYRKEGTVFPGNFFDQKISLQSGFSHAGVNDRFNVSFTINYTNNDNRMPDINLVDNITLAPNAPELFDHNGNLNWENDTWTNPFGALRKRNRILTNNYVGNGNISYKILPQLIAKVSFGLNQIRTQQKLVVPSNSLSPIYSSMGEVRRNTLMNNDIKSWIVEPQLTYRHDFPESALDLLIGTTFRENNSNVLTQQYWNFADDALIENIRAAGNSSTLFFSDAQYRYHAVFGRIGYNWKERYVINLTGRRDGSSRFGPNKQWANFGAIGAAWIITDEPLLKDKTGILSFAKLRGSYGITGNDQLPDYQYLSAYNSLPNSIYLNNPSLIPARLHNPDFSWESVKKLETALELGLFEDRVFITANWYRNRTGNQLVGLPLPLMTGFASIQANLPAIIENKGIEIELTSTVGKPEGFSWTFSGNLNFPRNTLLSYPDFENSTYRQTYMVGKSLFGMYRFQYQGVDETTGLYTFNDVNGNGQYDYDGDRSFVEAETRFHGGMVHSFSWKGIQLSLVFQYMKRKAETFNFYGSPGAFNQNQPVSLLDRWQNIGDTDRSLQKVTSLFHPTQSLYVNSDGMLTDFHFIRLKNLHISYSIPDRIVKKGRLQKVNLFLQGQNLFTFTNYKGIDPETAHSTLILPPMRMINAGINLVL